jgi:hypothetical protein
MDTLQTQDSRFKRAHEVTTFSKYFALTLFVILPFIGGYIGYQYGKMQKLVETVVAVPHFDTVMKPDVVPGDVTFTEETDFYAITTVRPKESKDVNDVMAQYVDGLIAAKQTEWKIGGPIHLAEQEVSADFPDRPKVTYVLDVRYSSTTSQKLGTVSYVFMITEMTGGANGNVAITTFTFDKNGQVAIDSILDYENGKDIALTRLLAEVAVEQNPLAFQSRDQLMQGLGLAYLKSDGVTFDAVACGCDGFFFPSNFQNFSVTDSGLTFTFSKYAIAPGAVMTPEISLTWAQLAPYLTATWGSNLALD